MPACYTSPTSATWRTRCAGRSVLRARRSGWCSAAGRRVMLLEFAAVIAASYLVGSIPFGYIAGRVQKGIDVRDYGSGATGATSVMRTRGRGAFVAVLLGDALKGYAPVLVTWYLFESHDLQVASGLAAVGGDDFPVYIGFRGGRGGGPVHRPHVPLYVPDVHGDGAAGSAGAAAAGGLPGGRPLHVQQDGVRGVRDGAGAGATRGKHQAADPGHRAQAGRGRRPAEGGADRPKSGLSSPVVKCRLRTTRSATRDDGVDRIPGPA